MWHPFHQSPVDERGNMLIYYHAYKCFCQITKWLYWLSLFTEVNVLLNIKCAEIPSLESRGYIMDCTDIHIRAAFGHTAKQSCVTLKSFPPPPSV